MATGESQSELEKLRAEIAQLKAAKEEQAAQEAQEAQARQLAQEQAIQESISQETVSVDPESQESVNEQAQVNELMELLGKEIKDLPTVTTLAVFSLGLLMGRYLR